MLPANAYQVEAFLAGGVAVVVGADALDAGREDLEALALLRRSGVCLVVGHFGLG